MRCLLLSFLVFVLPEISLAQPATVPVGVAKVDITPSYPVRLSGYGFRRTESEGVIQKIYAKAMVIGDKEPVMVLAVDVCGLSHEFVEKFAEKLKQKLGLPRDRLAVTVTHTHTAPMVGGYLTTLFGVAVPEDHQKRIDQFTQELQEKMLTVAEQAWKNRQASHLSWGIGYAGFARNRRPTALQTPSVYGSNPSPLAPLPKGERGALPVDHDLPVLAVRDEAGKLRAIWVNYACHCTTMSLNKITGDWAGYAAQFLEEENPGCITLVSIGCGADSNPERADRQDKIEYAEKQGGFVAAEVKRMLNGFLAPLPGKIVSKFDTFTLPLSALPSEQTLQERAKKNDAVGYQARMCLERLAKGEKLPAEIPYSVQTWSFGNDLAMVFLPGEVVVDYSLRLKQELHAQRLWVNAYSNHVPCYIPSERILKEGGYEGGGAMVYYNLSSPLASGVEDKIIKTVKEQLPAFSPPYDVSKLAGTRPMSAQQSGAVIKVDPKYTVELVASEPLVVDPVAISFGVDGRLWVAEMGDYPQGSSSGRVRVLEDTNGDGKYDKGTVFLDNIPYPTGVTAWRKGVLVCAAPDIFYAEDTDGDGKADVVKKLFSGFGTHNFQARVNSLEYGLDGWVYGSCGLFGGNIKSFNGKTYALGNRDFRIKPDTGELEPATGQTQQGRVRDDFDNWFGCDNTVLARHYPIADHFLSRNASVKPPANSIFLPTGNNANRLFPLRSQVQLFELSGPPGWPTAACGLGVYRDTLLGESLKGQLFTCEPVNLIVHRLQLQQQGATFTGQRPADEPNFEFLGSIDNWFRPVQMRTGPDGCIWIVDMHRLVIEHPIWIPPADLAKLDVRAGSTMGRIFKIKPTSGKAHAVPRFDRMDTAQLIGALYSPNGTQRDLAMMQLLWNKSDSQMKTSVEWQLPKLPEVKVQLLSTLALLGKLDAGLIRSAITDSHEAVRKTGWRLAEKLPALNGLLDSVTNERLSKESIPVLMQMAWTLGSHFKGEGGNQLASILLTHPDDAYLRAAVFSSLRPEHGDTFLTAMIQAAHQGKASPELMMQLIATLTADPQTAGNDMLKRLAVPSDKGYATWQYRAVASLPVLKAATVSQEHQSLLQPMYRAARALVKNEATPEADRLAALSIIMGSGQKDDDLNESRSLLFSLLHQNQTPALQQAAFAVLAKNMNSGNMMLMLVSWHVFSPAIRSQLVDLMLSRDEWQRDLLEAVEKKLIAVSQIDASSRQRLLLSRKDAIRQKAEGLFSQVSSNRAGLIAEYSQAISKKGNVQHGKEVFTKTCSVCHQLGEQGHAVGPDLTALANRTHEFLLQEILDPNKNLDNRYVEYVCITKEGRTITGLLSSESGNAITLKGKEGRQETLLRSEIEEIKASGKSLMPEGLEKEISPAAMSDLIAYLSSLRANYKVLAGNTPAGVILPVNSVHTLKAEQAEIYGKDITFEKDYQNIGYWHDAKDYVSWTIDVPVKGEYDVYFDWACANDNAGNPYVLEIGSTTVNHEVAGTGGWSSYLRVRVAAAIELQAGVQRVKLRPGGPLKGALMDLRTVYIAPAEHRLNLAEGTSREKPDVNSIAQQILNDKLSDKDRQKAIEDNLSLAPELLVAMTKDMPDDLKEEYRRIPWIWRVAIAAAKKNDFPVVQRIMDLAMPKPGDKLRDWQAVVIGGGVINGHGLVDLWPHEQMKKLIDTPERQMRWQWVLKESHVMAHNEKVHTGTRYDALRIIALDKPELAIPNLKKYLSAGGNDEMQMGAVSGLIDVPTAEAEELIGQAFSHLKGENRELALIGMMRSPQRFELVLKQVDAGAVKPGDFNDKLKQQLRKQSVKWPEALRARVNMLMK